MERLTHENMSIEECNAAVEKCAAYENTGLEPSEVAELKAENERLDEKRMEFVHKYNYAEETRIKEKTAYECLTATNTNMHRAELAKKDKRIAVLEKTLQLIKEDDVCKFCQGRAHYYNQKIDVDYFVRQAESELNQGGEG